MNSVDKNESESKKRKLEIENSESVSVGVTLPNGTVPYNSHIREMIKIVKPYIWHLVEDANLVIKILQSLIGFALIVKKNFFQAENVDFISYSKN